MPNILYLSYDGILDPLGQSQILPYLIGLANKGHQIQIMSFEKADFTKHSKNIHQNIDWYPLVYHKKPPILGTLYDIYKLQKLAIKIVSNNTINIVHCRSYITSIIGLKLKNKFGLKFIFDMRGFWADERIEGGIWNRKNLLFNIIYNYFKNKEKEFIWHADHIISLTESAEEEITDNTKLSANRKNIKDVITVIPTCVDTSHFSPEAITEKDQIELKSNLGIANDEYILLYLGSIGTWYMLEEMLLFFIILKEKKKNARFLFITTEPSTSILNSYKSICASKGIDFTPNDLIIKKSERKDIPLYVSICSSSIFFIRPTYSKKASSATKMGELLAMGKPIITNSGWGDTGKLVTSSIGVILDNFNTQSYEISIDEILGTNYNTEEIRKYSKGYFDLKIGIEKYNLIYNKISMNG